MLWLLLSVLSSFFIVLTFKYLQQKKMRLFPVVVLNYFSASALGFALNDIDFSFKMFTEGSWFVPSLIIGVLLIIMFWVIGFSTQRAGVAVTTVSNKMSVIIPISFSIIYYAEPLPALKVIGIIAAVLSVLLSVYKKRSQSFNAEQVYLPLILFIGVGLIDALIKYAQQDLLGQGEIPLFTAASFGIAGIAGIFTALVNKSKIRYFTNRHTLVTGLLLGVANFGSIYFLILALEYSGIDSSIVYAVNNMGIITLSIIAAALFFKEVVTRINWVGFALAFIAIMVLMYI